MIEASTLLILVGWALAGGSPGPATLAISGTAMSQGRKAGLVIAAGIVCGSATWGVAAGAGMSALMLAHGWVFEAVRYAGAAYLFYLSVKAFRRALSPSAAGSAQAHPAKKIFLKGFLLHLTNPKAILSWGAIYAIALPAGADATAVWHLFGLLIATSMLVFFGYGLLFSSAPIARGYARLGRWFDLAFGCLFGAASLKLMTTSLK